MSTSQPGLTDAEFAYEFANTAAGQSTAAAIVTSCLFFLFMVPTAPSVCISRYGYYDFIVASILFRAIAYAARAAYLQQYSPALQGVFLAFGNGGYGASVAALVVAQGSWMVRTDVLYMPLRLHKALRTFHFCCIIPLVAFGPFCGVVAAGLIYGAYDCCVGSWQAGVRCRVATSWGLWSVNTVTLVLSVVESLLVTWGKPTAKPEAMRFDVGHPTRKPKLIWLLTISALLLECRGSFNLVGVYRPNLFRQDRLWYPLNTLPELLELCLVCWPLAYVKATQGWPRVSRSPTSNSSTSSAAQPQQGMQHLENIQKDSGFDDSAHSNSQSDLEQVWCCAASLARHEGSQRRYIGTPAKRKKVSEAPHKPQRQQQQLNQAQRPAVGNPEAEEDAEEVPEQVYSRILARILTFTGVPVFVGMLLFPLFYYLKVTRHVDLPMAAVYGVQFLTFGGGLFGISYGILSASWDPRLEGSRLGWTEFRANLPLIIDRMREKGGRGRV